MAFVCKVTWEISVISKAYCVKLHEIFGGADGQNFDDDDDDDIGETENHLLVLSRQLRKVTRFFP